jgi:hypothetical protein
LPPTRPPHRRSFQKNVAHEAALRLMCCGTPADDGDGDGDARADGPLDGDRELVTADGEVANLPGGGDAARGGGGRELFIGRTDVIPLLRLLNGAPRCAVAAIGWRRRLWGWRIRCGVAGRWRARVGDGPRRAPEQSRGVVCVKSVLCSARPITRRV